MYRTARNGKKLSIDEAAKRLFISARSLSNYELGTQKPSPDVAIQMDRVYEDPKLSAWYCRNECAIGQQYCYDLLNNVDLSPMGILTKYRQEEAEAHEALEKIALLLLNKRNKKDCTDQEIKELERWSQEMLDLEHVIETLKIRLWDFLNVADLVRDHNEKCKRKKYVVDEEDQKMERSHSAATEVRPKEKLLCK
ncbi:helix-turn-helix domain-containing protein [Tindallia californiensis]|uniref:Helix-turn-helix n=1 Tax=Tindallia californiensis TaxID=159292 RepID=A0A1H3QZV5_9FIRM|nr:helix-turn-helix transcriptional regulator [Tindallia californiensis]SDZ18957.1 Helix-turn-helix [Tindallia californiensis]